MPEPRTRLPFHVLLTDLAAAAGLSTTDGWLLNQNGLPAASRASRTGTSVAASTSGGGCLPLTGNVTVWKPRNSHCTLSLRCTVTARGKKALGEACLGAPLRSSCPA